MSVFETGIVTEVFGLARPELDVTWYDLRVCSPTRRPLRLLGGATLRTPHGLDDFAAADTLIVPGVSDVHRPVGPAIVRALLQADERKARIISICSGTFALADAGLLNGRRATTHWRYVDVLRSRFPRIEVDPDVLYVDHGRILTSAGSAAGLDLCLHVVRKDFGARVANVVARRLVTQPHRDGGQAQFIEDPVSVSEDDDRLGATMTWALAHLSRRISLADLADKAQMSERTYLRHFFKATGTSPIRWLIHQRVHASLPLLEASNESIEGVATKVGFETATTYRHHFSKTMRTTPSAYRAAFRGSPS